MNSTDRRQFLSRFVGGAAVTLALPSLVTSCSDPDSEPPSTGSLEAPEGGQDQEAFWERVKERFPLSEGLILMNAANLCPSPASVQEAVFELTRDLDADASFQARGKFGPLREESRNGVARLLKVSPHQVALTRNTSESNNTVVNGLELGPGDEVVIWDQNHPTNNVAWDVRAERWGFSVRRVSTPPAPVTSDALIDAFRSVLSDRTRVLAFSHASNVSGVRLPARALCGLAREVGALSLVDGAQTFGVLDLDLEDMGCDFYTASAHKWFMGPKEVGILYLREDRLAGLWPSDVGVGWEGAVEGGARKFENLGQRDDAAVSAVATAVEFHEALTSAGVEARSKAITSHLKERLQERIPSVRFHTPLDPELSAGVVVFALPDVEHRQIFNALYEDHRIGCAAMSGEFDGIRLSPHIYNTLAEVDRVVTAVAAYA